jgi:UDP-2,3-diacylglucosamine hydrolase
VEINQNVKRILSISDLHLWGPEDPLYRGFIKFLDEEVKEGDHLFILGDLFDLFVGPKDIFQSRFSELLSKLKEQSEKKVFISYIEGNHDFQLENLFEDWTDFSLYAENINIQWNGKRFFFCHGDKVNKSDWSYLGFRLFTRNILTQTLIEAVPGNFIDRLGSVMSKASRNYHYEANEEIITLYRNYACEKISSGMDFIVIGHTHYKDEMKFRFDSHEGQYLNVGYPRKHRVFAEMKKGDEFFTFKSLDAFINPTKIK